MRKSTPIKAQSINVITTLDLSGSSLEGTNGSAGEMMSSINDLNLSDISASTYETIGFPRKITFRALSPGEEFMVESQAATSSDESYFEEPDTPRQLPPLQPAAVLRDVTNEELPYNGPPAKVDRLDDLMEPLVEEIENAYGINLQNSCGLQPVMRTWDSLHFYQADENTQAAGAHH